MNVIEESTVIGEFQQQNAHAEDVSDNEEEEEDEDPTRHNLENVNIVLLYNNLLIKVIS